MRSEFQKLDTNQSGFLEPDNIKEALSSIGQRMNLDSINAMIDEIDFAGNHKINYTEFIAATIETSQFLSDQRLQSIFDTFDVDRSGYITPANIKDAFSKMGREISDEDINDIYSRHDFDGDRAICIQEFKMIMLDQEDEYETEEYAPRKKSIEDLYN